MYTEKRITSMQHNWAAAAVVGAALLSALIVVQSGGGASTPELQERLDAVVAAGVPGAILLVRTGDETIRLTSGYGRLKNKTPIRTTDRFRVGSLTKTFVAALVLQLAGERKLSLEDSVERWLPGIVPDGQHITIRQLLNMKAGLYEYPNDPRIEADFVKGNWAHKWQPANSSRSGSRTSRSSRPARDGRTATRATSSPD
jgi:D-alanyl-D-alanine carboxypeptidase